MASLQAPARHTQNCPLTDCTQRKKADDVALIHWSTNRIRQLIDAFSECERTIAALYDHHVKFSDAHVREIARRHRPRSPLLPSTILKHLAALGDTFDQAKAKIPMRDAVEHLELDDWPAEAGDPPREPAWWKDWYNKIWLRRPTALPCLCECACCGALGYTQS
jgi:hypothetical protein